ncbi:ATP-dependent RNA helicase DDX23, putative [Plasmodium gallinaceum]|uniref:RNA helicase n=1 Tax=Plasmodium gallinaceum TaxID=5849 RepID=A0A1J1GZD8_PLAGA|nr:ATP-dependent RNA helicase DDX23, putative [Plasmodium gallinaceum]CRG97964.1 ATP-dependent RNA helicase DDX23, putative [Plasmodium gallinaceum]
MKESNTEKKNMPIINNPFLNIKKDNLDEKKEVNLLNEETVNNTRKNDHIKEKKKKNELDGVMNNIDKNSSHGIYNKKLNENEIVKDKKNTVNIDNFSFSSSDSKEHLYKSLPKSKVKNIIKKYSSSSSDEEDDDFNKNEFKKNTKSKENEMDYKNNNTSDDLRNIKYQSKKMFANISNNDEKLIFLPKKVREENRRKLEKQNEIINKNEEVNKKNYTKEESRKNKEEKTDYNDKKRQKRKELSEDKKRKDIIDEKKKMKKNEEKYDSNCNTIEEYKSSHAKPESSLAELNMLNISNIEKESLREKEIEIIKQQYLGLNKKKKKIQKPSEKFRNIFNFEWDQSEDTSRNDNNPLYQNRLEPQLLFGRGYIAGIDVREQRKKNNFYDKLVQNRINLNLKKNVENSLKKDNSGNVTNNLNNSSLSKNKSGEFIYEPKVNNIIKDVCHKHWSEKKREEMTDRDWRIFREDNEIYIKGGIVPPPIRTWEESNLSVDLLKAIKKAKYDKPTPIQMQAIPIALEMRDLIGIAETGSGKTAAFVLPMLSYVKQLPPLTYETSQDGPYALIIAPSRELAIQIYEETNKFASYCSCRMVAIVGGRNAESQAFELRRGVEIIIGTPGRIQDCLEKAYTVLNQCNYVIIDEADRMMDMGFEDTVHYILDKIPTSNLKSEDDALALQEEMMAKAGHRLYRLTQMFSATMPPSVERLSRKYLRAPAYISIGDPGAGKRSIEQKLEFITEGKKKQKLQELLEIHEPPIIVFVNQKKVADIIAKSISKMKFRAVSLHGGKPQEIREQTLAAFKNSEFDILVATDVAGRGIDVHGVKLVINFDMPKDIESYTHRIGRTGRAGMKGLAISFLTEHDTHLFYDLKQFMLSSNNLVPLELSNHPASKVKPGTIVQTPKKNQILYKN